MPRWTGRAGALSATAVFVLLATRFGPWRLFERGPYTADFYDVQGRALTRGRLSVPSDVAGLEGFLVGEDTHLYFGVVPAIVRTPLVVWGDHLDGRLVLLSMSIAVLIGALAVARIVVRAAAELGDELPSWAPDAAAAAFGLATPVLWLASRSLVYHEAEIWGAVLAIVGCERALAWWSTRGRRDLVIAGLLAVLALNTRASSGLAPALALGGFALLLLATDRSPRRAVGPAAFAMLAVALYAAVNAARFGSPLSVPFDDQVFTALSEDRRAMLEETGGSFFSLRFVPSTVLQYLRPDALRPDRLFPFVDWGPRAENVGGAPFDTIDRAGSVTTTMPALVVAVFTVPWRRVTVHWWVVVSACAISTVPTLAIGFIAHRYLVDFVPLLVILAALGLPRLVSARMGRLALGGLAAVGCLVALTLGITAQRLYLLPSPSTAASFIAFRYDVYGVVGSDPPPGLQAHAVLPPEGEDGIVAVVGRCDGVYLGIGDGWNRVEVTIGGAFAMRLAGAGEPGTVVSGNGWSVDLVESGGELALRYAAGERTIAGETLPRDDGPVVVLTVLSDPVSSGVQITDDSGRLVLDAWLSPGGGPLEAGPGWTEQTERPALCSELADRLDLPFNAGAG